MKNSEGRPECDGRLDYLLKVVNLLSKLLQMLVVFKHLGV